MGVHRLRLKEHQPFYHVLVSGDGSNRYAAQENLKPLGPTDAMDIDHPEVGKHFVKREGGHYKLNRECAQVFLEDDEYREAKYPE